MRQKVIGDILDLPQLGDGLSQIAGVPEDDGCDQQVEAGGRGVGWFS